MGYTAAEEDLITYRYAKAGFNRKKICERLGVSESYFAAYLEKRFKSGRIAHERTLKQQLLQRLP